MTLLIAGLVSGSLLTVAVAYIVYLHGRVKHFTKDIEAYRALIKLFSEREIVAAMSDEQLQHIMIELSQVVIAAIQGLDPERLS